MSTSAQTSLPVSDLPFLDITVPGFVWEDPAVAAAREQCWAARTPLGLLVLRYAEVRELQGDPRLITDLRHMLERNGVTSGPLHAAYTTVFQGRNDEDHRRFRQPAGLAFTSPHVTGLRPFVREAAQQLAEQLATGETCDFMEVFAYPLLLTLAGPWLGIPYDDALTARRWINDALLGFSLDANPELLPRAEEAAAQVHRFAETLVRERKASPRNDLISDIIRRAQKHQGAVSDTELTSMIMTLLPGSVHNSGHQLGHAMVAFARHPEQWSLLRERPGLVEQAVEEVLRWCPAVSANSWRVAAEDFIYQGLHIPAGSDVWLSTHSAQRDPRAFTQPDTFDITAERTTPLLLFGGGPHQCPGVMLARAELTETLTALTSRLEPPVITGPITWQHSIINTGPDTLPLHF